MTWINFSVKFFTINTYTTYQWKEPGIQAESISHKYKVGSICGFWKHIKLITHGDKIGFSLQLQKYVRYESNIYIFLPYCT